MNRTALACTTIATLGLLGAAALVTAGPLDPPAGPVASTHKTLSEVEPRIAINAGNTRGDADSLFKITQPGSYYLTGNVTGEAGRHGIEIAASGVTIDLAGFDLVGVAGMGAFDGVTTSVLGLTDIDVRNGSVRNWGDEGVDLGSFSATNSIVADLRASGNAGGGIHVGNGGTATACTAHQNGSTGISASTGCTITGCAAYDNTGHGISAGTGSTVASCATNGNTGHGISAGTGSTVTGCAVFVNTGDGINTGIACTVATCTVRANTGDGIEVSSQCLVIGNTCSSNGNNTGDGAGIHATNADNRIEGNNCTFADRGIEVAAFGNIIVRNTCSGNTINWDIAAGNVCLVVNATAGAAILGNAGGAGPGSTDPNANFTY